MPSSAKAGEEIVIKPPVVYDQTRSPAAAWREVGIRRKRAKKRGSIEINRFVAGFAGLKLFENILNTPDIFG